MLRSGTAGSAWLEQRVKAQSRRIHDDHQQLKFVEPKHGQGNMAASTASVRTQWPFLRAPSTINDRSRSSGGVLAKHRERERGRDTVTAEQSMQGTIEAP